MRKVITVFANDINKAREKLNEILKNLNEAIITESENRIMTENYVLYAYKSSFTVRSMRMHEIYVHNEIKLDSDVFRHVLVPHLTPYDRTDTDYKWKEHVHYFE